MNLGVGPPAPPLALYSPSVCLSVTPHLNPNITVSLSFSADSHKDTYTCQSDPKQKRKEDLSG